MFTFSIYDNKTVLPNNVWLHVLDDSSWATLNGLNVQPDFDCNRKNEIKLLMAATYFKL